MPYIYRVENLVTSEFYYGARYVESTAPEEDLWIKYFTSSKKIKKLIADYGIHSFLTTVLEIHTDVDKCYQHEQVFIKENIHHPLCLNKQYRECGSVVFLNKGHSQETKIRISETTKGRVGSWNTRISPSTETRQRISNSCKGVSGSKKGVKKGPRPAEVTKKIVETRLRRNAERKLQNSPNQ